MTVAEANLFRAQLVVEELYRLGTSVFVVCPGSRSAPLTLALSQDKRVRVVVHNDERGAGYYAVGYARATRQAAGVVTTSGTAAVNLYPAVVEASMDNLPLLAITADRPPELHDCGANQTIDQDSLFGDFVRCEVPLECPDEPAEQTGVLSAIDGMFNHAFRSFYQHGPAHINCQFREPLVPSPAEIRSLSDTIARSSPDLAGWWRSGGAYGVTAAIPTPIDAASGEAVTQAIGQAQRGVLIIGALRSEQEQQAALGLSRRLGWPTLADITSGLSGAGEPQIVGHYDLILASDRFGQDTAPDTILHVGGRISSKRLLEFIERHRPSNYFFNAGDGVIFDPLHAVSSRTAFDTAQFCRILADRIKNPIAESPWLQSWTSAASHAREVINESCSGTGALTEPYLAFSLSRRLKNSSAFFVASSMPIRDMDMFAAFDHNVTIAANRGASGIDGTIASACGYATGLNRPVTVLLGDQAFLHDLNSLAFVRHSPIPMIIVIVNNNGGRIFELLPVSDHKQVLEPLFVAPHNLTFGKIAETFGITHVEVRDRTAFEQAYDRAAASDRTTIIESIIDPALSREHRIKLIRAAQTFADRT